MTSATTTVLNIRLLCDSNNPGTFTVIPTTDSSRVSSTDDGYGRSLTADRVKKAPTVLDDPRLHSADQSTLTELVKYSTDLQKLVALGVSFTEVEKHEGGPDVLANTPYDPVIRGKESDNK